LRFAVQLLRYLNTRKGERVAATRDGPLILFGCPSSKEPKAARDCFVADRSEFSDSPISSVRDVLHTDFYPAISRNFCKAKPNRREVLRQRQP
jgi:hypothetical protein